MLAENNKVAEASENDVQRVLSHMDDNERRHYDKAIDEGYKNEVCGRCTRILLAHKHFIRCHETECPMIARNPDGSPKPSLLDQLIASTTPK